VLIVWECETRDRAALAQRLAAYLNDGPPKERLAASGVSG